MVAFTVLRAPPTPGPNLRDFEAYWSAGATWLRGEDPYTRAIWIDERTVPGVDASRGELLPFVGPAAFRPLWTSLARLPFAAASRVWLAVLAVCAGIIGIGSLRLASRRRPRSAILATVTFTLAFAPCMSALALGQSALVAAAAIVAAALAFDAGALPAAAAAVACATIQPNLALPILARVRDRRSLAAVTVAGAAFVAATAAFGGGFSQLAAYAHLLGTHGAAERFDVIQWTPAAIAWGFGATPEAARALGVLAACSAAAAAIAVLARVRLDPPGRTAFACAALPLCVPFFHEHDFVVLLFPAIVMARRARGAALALACGGSLFAAVDWLGFAQRPLAAAQQIAMAASAAAGFVVLARVRTRSLVATACAVVAFVAVVGTAATHAPAPTWPDALPPHFGAAATLDAADAWHREQTAAHLETRSTAWAALRLLGLCGAGALAASFAVERRPARRRRPSGVIALAAPREPVASG